MNAVLLWPWKSVSKYRKQRRLLLQEMKMTPPSSQFCHKSLKLSSLSVHTSLLLVQKWVGSMWHHFTNLHLCSGFSPLCISIHSSVCSWSFILSSCPFLMLVPKSGKAKGMKRPPYTSPTPPISALSLPLTPVTINTMTLWSSVIHIYCVFELTWWFWPVFLCFVSRGWLVWSLCPIPYFQLKTVLLCSLLVEPCLLLCLTVVTVSLMLGFLWVSHIKVELCIILVSVWSAPS